MAETTARHAEKSSPSSFGRSALLLLRDLVVVFLLAVLISFLVKTFLLKPFYIPSESMANTLQVNDRIAVSLLTPGPIDVQRGDVVVFEDPGGWLHAPPAESPGGVAGVFRDTMVFIGLAPDESHGYLVKRVIGLPGDTVECCNDFGQLLVNGVPINEQYLQLDQEGLPASGIEFDVTVPEGSYWVMGDNRYHSADSRSHQDGPHDGFVPHDNLVGRAIVITWPMDRWSWLDNHSGTFSGVPDGTP
ncbi:MAG TPA: signal peptidase I [Candidatus Agrococcus pullicola]|uniref:Signal peptidase I n=1 Tax=Candidatus Agrococcus pullicola TaxID=2838429 RepID=A0A9D1YYA4_9MICO|nr:signal peptidase I [Candidatus Agrococcus pullicola]